MNPKGDTALKKREKERERRESPNTKAGLWKERLVRYTAFHQQTQPTATKVRLSPTAVSSQPHSRPSETNRNYKPALAVCFFFFYLAEGGNPSHLHNKEERKRGKPSESKMENGQVFQVAPSRDFRILGSQRRVESIPFHCPHTSG